MRVDFKVKRTTRRDPGRATVNLYNLDTVSRGIIEATGVSLILRAGYGLIPFLLFSGDVSKRGRKTTRKGPDIITTIEGGDGELLHQDIAFDIAYTGPIDNQTILLQILAAMATGLAPADPLLPMVYPQGAVFYGSAADALDTLCGDVGQEWSIQDGLLQILHPSSTRKDGAVLLTSETGLVGIPTKTDKGLNLVSLLNGNIKPGSLVSVGSLTYTGFAKAKKVEHVGDTHGKVFHTKIEAREL
jgi:hypothetical protein